MHPNSKNDSHESLLTVLLDTDLTFEL